MHGWFIDYGHTCCDYVPNVDMSYKYYLGPEIGTYMYGNKQTLHKMYYVKILLIFNLFDVGTKYKNWQT